MAKKQTGFKTQGMNRDLSVSAFNPEFVFENMNLRLSTNEGNTLLSWVNEKGTEEITGPNFVIYDAKRQVGLAEHNILGIAIGTAILNDQLVLFTTNGGSYYASPKGPDHIFVIRSNDNGTYFDAFLLYEGNLNFSVEHPLETLVSYEADNIKKVYWVDGINQPRVINIAEDVSKYTDTSFNFIPNISKFSSNVFAPSDVIAGIKVERGSSDGLFAPGIIQYCFTYINKYRQQSNVVGISPLYYLAYNDRGASPEDKVSSSFNITITNANEIFDYVRLYSIQRTSLDGVPVVKILEDLPIVKVDNEVSAIKYTDNGTTGAIIDPTELIYVGGKEIVAGTMADKDGTLFLGDIEEKNILVNDIQQYFDSIRSTAGHNGAISFSYGKTLEMQHTTGIYSYTNTLNSSQDKVTTFKGGESYRFGFQLQKETGEWTEPIFIEDKLNSLYPKTSVFSDTVKLIDASANIDFFEVTKDAEASDAVNQERYNNRFNQFVKVRPVIVYPNQTDRNVLCQGVLNPTVFNVQDRKTNSPFAQASWYFRPYMANNHPQNPISGGSIAPLSITKATRTRESQPITADSNFTGKTHTVYIVVATLTGTLDVTVSDGRLHYIILDNDNDDAWVESRSVAIEGILDISAITITPKRYAFVVSEPITKPDGNNYRVSFQWADGVPRYDNYPYQLYNNMYTENEELRYGGDGAHSEYVFYFCDYENPTEKGDYYTVTFNAYTKNDYTTISNNDDDGTGVRFKHYDYIVAQSEYDPSDVSPIDPKMIEIQGSENEYSSVSDTPATTYSNTQFFVDQSIVTLNSPDIEFDTNVQVADTSIFKLRIVGAIPLTANVSAHSINISSNMLETGNTYTREVNLKNTSIRWTTKTDRDLSFGSGELDKNITHKNIDLAAGQKLVAEYLWNDIMLNKNLPSDDEVSTASTKADYLIHPWHRSGSLNNDYRPNDSASSLLNTKKESNMLFSITSEYFPYDTVGTKFQDIGCQIILTENAEVMNYRLPKQSAKTSEINYYPNIDKILYNGTANGYVPIKDQEDPDEGGTVRDVKYTTPVSMKYKSTSHAVIALNAVNNYIPILPYGEDGIGHYDESSEVTTFWGDKVTNSQATLVSALANLFVLPNVTPSTHVKFNYLWLGELYKDTDPAVKFGGSSKEALRKNTWCIAGEAKPFEEVVNLRWNIGDTYYQRYDCLKTYPFTKEDPNQLVEILSFMCETHVNIDGRYDRNRGQTNNTNMSPVNFNLLNPVYSQTDSFFVARKTDTEDLDKLTYPNQIYYTKTKNSGADVDLWTNVTLGSVLEMDGDKGRVTSLQRFNDQILAFQDTGISQILYNENMQISTTEGVPIEIANSGKVTGKRYISDTIGCSNKWSIVNTPSGIYFMDDHDKSIYLFNGQLANLSTAKGFNSWCKQNFAPQGTIWCPSYKKQVIINDTPTYQDAGFENFVGYYDKLNQDVLWINKETALAYSEKVGNFTSFYDYGNTPFFCNFKDMGLWINSVDESDLWHTKIHEHQGGDYCKFFGVNKPYWMTLVGNPEPQMDKIFTNLEFRACVDGEGAIVPPNGENTVAKYNPFIPFDSLESWDEYQHGIAQINIRSGHDAFIHHLNNTDGAGAALKKKFRIWRCDVPRDNCAIDAVTENPMGIYRHYRKPNDRMRNPWVYLKLMKEAAESGSLPRAEIHDVILTYYS